MHQHSCFLRLLSLLTSSIHSPPSLHPFCYHTYLLQVVSFAPLVHMERLKISKCWLIPLLQSALQRFATDKWWMEFLIKPCASPNKITFPGRARKWWLLLKTHLLKGNAIHQKAYHGAGSRFKYPNCPTNKMKVLQQTRPLDHPDSRVH